MTSYSFTLISDLHGWKPVLPGGDVLIIAGDLVAHSTEAEYAAFRDWVALQPYNKTIITPGNHDTLIQEENDFWLFHNKDVELLIDQPTTWNGIKFYATPWTLTFIGMNPQCKAFTVDTEEQALEAFQKIPKDTNVLVSHSPPQGILSADKHGEWCGSVALRNCAMALPNLKLHVFGHIHEAHGRLDTTLATFINASAVDERYKPRNPTYTLYEYHTD